MRAVLHHLIRTAGVTHPGAVVQFIDADIRPAYFSPRWVLDPVGAVLWFQAVEAAKVVYHRPRGGRLNALLRAFLSQCPGEGLQSLQKLVYLLSGEIAATLRFWTALPFKSGYGIETLTLVSLAADRLQLRPGTPDLAHVVQVCERISQSSMFSPMVLPVTVWQVGVSAPIRFSSPRMV